MLGGFILGPAAGMGAVALYLLAGVVGLPVFAGGKAGLAPLLGPTGGFLLGFAVQAGLCGLAARGRNLAEAAGPAANGRGFAGLWRYLVFGLAGTLGLYAFGLPWLAAVLGIGLSKALAVGALPFILGDLAKIAAAALIVGFLARARLLPR